MNTQQKEIMIPKEILSYAPPPPFVFPLAKYYVTSFKTDLSALEGMLPEKVKLSPGAENNILLQVNHFGTYWESVLSIPVIFKNNGEESSGVYLSQLYLGSIIPEGSALPMLLGQIGAGYPKRDAIFTIDGFSEKTANVKFERWGTTIASMQHKMGKEITDYSNLPFGSDLTNLNAFLFKAIPACDGSGWDVLQLTTPISEGGDIIRVNEVKTNINGDITLDSGRVLPVKEVQYSLYYEIENISVSHAEILNDYLAD